jgi:glycine cleavage system H protein
MATIDGYEFPDDLWYTEEHVWARVEADVVTIGLSQFGQELAGRIAYVEMPLAGRAVTKGEPFMSMESGKWVGRVKAPVSGTIVEANGELEWESETVNKDPYGKGWLAKIKASNPAEVNALLKAGSPELAALISAERTKYGK